MCCGSHLAPRLAIPPLGEEGQGGQASLQEAEMEAWEALTWEVPAFIELHTLSSQWKHFSPLGKQVSAKTRAERNTPDLPISP